MVETGAGGLRPTVAVVGGGIAGLAAAWELTGGVAGAGDRTPRVVVVDSAPRLGGKLATADLDGRPVDVGPDGFLGRRPEAVDLCREVGLGEDLEPIGASGASVWARGSKRPLPAGLFVGVPTRVLPVVRSGILSPAGALRLLGDLVAPRPDLRGPLGDRAIGPLVAHKLGRQVVQRLVDPLLGGIHAGGVADASAAAVLPGLLPAAQRRASFVRALRQAATAQPAPPETPAFWTLRGGLASLPDRLCAQLAERGVRLVTGSPAARLGRGAGPAWVLETESGPVSADAVVLALPAGAAADLLEPHDAEAAALLRAVEYASVAVVTLDVPAGAVEPDLYGTGLLVPHGTPLPSALAETLGAAKREPYLVTACTYLWSKWPHLAREGSLVLRASVGRSGDDRFASLRDDQLVARVVAELSVLLGLSGEPHSALVTRWPASLPQYRVHHLLRVAGVEAAVRRLGNLAVAGAAYRGVGIPACVASGRQAARDVLAQLAGEATRGEQVEAELGL